MAQQRLKLLGCRGRPVDKAARKRWLKDEVAPVYDAMIAYRDRGIPAETVFAGIRAPCQAPARSEVKRHTLTILRTYGSGGRDPLRTRSVGRCVRG